MLKQLQRGWRRSRCLAVGHIPSRRLLFCRWTAGGEEYLEGHDCTRCHAERFHFSWADRPPMMMMAHMAGEGAISPKAISLTPGEAVGFFKRQFADRGYEIVEDQPMPAHARRHTVASASRHLKAA